MKATPLRGGYMPKLRTDPHGYHRLAWTIAIAFWALALLASGFALGCVWFAVTQH